MKSLRWGACLLVVGSVVAFSGCRSTGRWLTPSEYDEYNTLKHLNTDQSAMISSLTNDKVILTQENDFLKANSATQKELLDALKAQLAGTQRNINSSPDLGQNVTAHITSKGEFAYDVLGDALFSSGEAKLKSKGETVLKELVAKEKLREKTNKIAIRGFTDSDPIKSTRGKWTDNFDLSGHRALAVLQFLEKEGIAPERLHFEGFGQYSLARDAAGNEDKAKSRRAEIILENENVNPSEVPGPAKTTPAAGHSRPKPPARSTTPMVPK